MVLDNGDWLISWARERGQAKPGYGNVEKAITQVDPRTGTRNLAFDIPNPSNTSVQANIRATTMPAYVLAPQPRALRATAPTSKRTSLFHKGDDDTPQVLVTFNRPVVDFLATSPSLSVTGGTVTGVSALVAESEPANAYLVTLDPAGEGAVTLRLVANTACADGGICAADGTTLKQALTVVVNPAPQVSFQRAAYSISEGVSGSVVVRLSRAHQIATGVTIPIVLDSEASSATGDDYEPDFATAQSVTFRRGETSKTFRIRASTDTLVEGSETVVLGFGTLPDAVGTGSISSTTVTLTDRTTASIDFSRFEGELAEGGSASFTFEITNGVTFAEDTTIKLAIGGNATPGDFTLEDASGSTLSEPYSVTLSAGASSTSFTVRATDDTAAEPVDETVTVSARLALTNASLGSRTVIISPSDIANVPDVTIAAGSSVTEGGTASFTLERTGDATAALTVSVKVIARDSTLSGGAPSSVTLAAGSATAVLSLPTRDDTVVRDGGGQVSVFLLGSPANPPAYLTTPANQASVTVLDDDVATFTVTASADELTEGRSLVLTVDTGGVTFPDAQTIELSLGGTATPTDDYLLPGGCTDSGTGFSCSLTLRQGARTARATFRTRYDGVPDSDESIEIDAYHNGSLIGSVSINLVDGAPPAPPRRPSPPSDPGRGGDSPSDPPASEERQSSGFADVDPQSVHAADIDALLAASITAGCSSQPLRFCPMEAVTRAQMASLLVRALELPTAVPSGFADVDPQSVHAADVDALLAAGITAGCSSQPLRFCPMEAVTRAQMASLLVRALELPTAVPSGFADVDPQSVHAADVDALLAAGITAGCSSQPLRFCPMEAVTRAQMASFLVRALDLS